jgi:tRNA A37 threonylcarbamoyladenosine modification protein TsaB
MKDNKTISLYLNTATKILEIGATVGEKSLTVKLGDPKKALERTHLGIQLLADQLGFALADVDCFYCLLGPGSNTGIRLGLTIPRTIYGINPKIRIYGLPTMELMLCGEKDATALLSDRSGNLFFGTAEDGKITSGRLEKKDVPAFQAEKIIIEEADVLAREELSGKNVLAIDVLSKMMMNPSAFHDFSDDEKDYLPEYALKI